jgi:hypothetical protein
MYILGRWSVVLGGKALPRRRLRRIVGDPSPEGRRAGRPNLRGQCSLASPPGWLTNLGNRRPSTKGMLLDSVSFCVESSAALRISVYIKGLRERTQQKTGVVSILAVTRLCLLWTYAIFMPGDDLRRSEIGEA